MSIRVQVFVFTYVFISPGHIPRSRIAGSHGDSLFNHVRNCQTVFQSSCIVLHSHLQCMRVPISLHPHFLPSPFPITAILLGVNSASLWFGFACPPRPICWAPLHGLIFYGSSITLPLLCSAVIRENITSKEAFDGDKIKTAWLRNIDGCRALFHSGHRTMTRLSAFLPIYLFRIRILKSC